jgi:hypothetical protein
MKLCEGGLVGQRDSGKVDLEKPFPKVIHFGNFQVHEDIPHPPNG